MFSVIAVWFKHRKLSRTLHAAVFDIDSSLAAVPADFFGLYRKLARTPFSVVFSG
jgi:hypothetical protein